jgi:hypothetical protein
MYDHPKAPKIRKFKLWQSFENCPYFVRTHNAFALLLKNANLKVLTGLAPLVISSLNQ